MKETVNLDTFLCRFNDIRPRNFSYAGLKSLFRYLEELEEDTGEEMEFDPIAFCSEYTEYQGGIKELSDDYPDIESLDDLRNETTVIMVDGGGFIIQNF